MSAPEEQATQQIEEGASVSILSRNEKKARKLLKDTGIKKVEGVTRIVMRKRGGTSFVIQSPDVYRTPNGGYVVFGEARVEQDMASKLAALGGDLGGADAASAAATAGINPDGPADKSPAAITADLEEAVKNASLNDKIEEIEDENADFSDVDQEKLNMVVEQANTTKAKAAKALRDNKGDLVNALMSLM